MELYIFKTNISLSMSSIHRFMAISNFKSKSLIKVKLYIKKYFVNIITLVVTYLSKYK